MSGALKTGSVFDCGKIPASRSYAVGGARYLRTDLMLLTHAKYAFKDPRGRFGISDSARPDAFGNRQRVEISLGHKALVFA